MANKGHGWLYLSEENGDVGELVNHARTAAYLQSSDALGCGSVYNVVDDGGCEAYTWTPNTDATWTQKVFTTPAADGAPWYNPSYPESAQALGFWITEWTGLDSGHVRRASTPIGAYRGGSVLGASSNAGRVMGIEMLMLAESEKAMEYLFQWFDSSISSVCSTCETDTILVRRYCTDVDTAAESIDGVVEIRGVGLVAGMVYGEDPVERAGCFLRRVNFTLEASDPCIYSLCTGEPVDQPMDWRECYQVATTLDPERPACRPECWELSDSCRAVYNYTVDTPSVSAPVITFTVPAPVTNAGGTYTSTTPLRIRTYMNPHGATGTELCSAPLLAELYLTALPAYSELKYDMSGRQILYHDAASGDWVNGFAFVEPNEPGVPRFAALGCGDYTTVIEPSNFCVTPTTLTPEAGTFLSDGNVATFADHPTLGLAVGGSFTLFGPVSQQSFGILNEQGRNVPFALALSASEDVNEVIVQPNGMILLAGSFTSALATTVNRIVRVRTDATIDPAWNIASTAGVNDRINDMALQTDGKIVIVGLFSAVRGVTKNSLARLNSDGTLDTGFNASNTAFPSVGSPECVLIQPDGKIIIGSAFLIHGVAKNGIARLNTDGSLDTTFNIGTNMGVSSPYAIHDMALQPDGKIIIAGQFPNARGVVQNNIARLNADGSLDTTFNIGAATKGVNNPIFALGLLHDGSMVIGGSFTAARGVTVKRLVRLTSTGEIHPDWDVAVAGVTSGGFQALWQDQYGKIMAGGSTWTTISGATRRGAARLHLDGTADLSFPATKVYYPAQRTPTIDFSLQERMGCV